jgi:sigma-B regulation protein RsbU (phosphoserine phosphatase)
MNYISPSSADNLELGQSVRDTFGLDRAIRASKILVVDDQPVISKLLGFYLNAGGYENWTFAEDGDDALEAIEADEPDLVLLDLQMPRMGGLKVYKVLRNNPRYLILPILVQTAADSPEDRAEVFRSGATDMVGKPVNDAELLARVGIHLQNRHMLNQLSVYRESMERELQLERDMQHRIMPNPGDLAKLNEKYGIEFKSHFQTCDALGGDMWNVWPVTETRMGFHIIDFTGHGVVASLNTFRFQSLVMATGFDPDDHAGYIEKINRRLHSMLPVGQFATAIGGYIYIREDVIRYIAAAGPKPSLKTPAEKDGLFLPSDGRPLGMTSDAEYSEREVPFPPGSSLFLYSDALTETPDMINPVYDEDRIQAALTGQINPTDHPFDVITADFFDRVREPLNDDLTMVMLSRPSRDDVGRR